MRKSESEAQSDTDKQFHPYLSLGSLNFEDGFVTFVLTNTNGLDSVSSSRYYYFSAEFSSPQLLHARAHHAPYFERIYGLSVLLKASVVN